MSQRDVKKILVLRFSSLGDIVMATAMVRCLRKRFPMAQIDMVVRSDFFDLIKDNPHLDRKIALPRKSGLRGLIALCKDLNQEHYDIIYDAHFSLRTLLLAPFLKAEHKVHFKKHYVRRSLALTFKFRLLATGRMLERYIDPLEEWGVKYDGLGPEVFVDGTALASALTKTGLTEKSAVPRLGFIPSAQWPGKRWSPERFREVLLKLHQETSYQLVVFGGPGDDFCGPMVEGFPKERVINTQGKLSLSESIALVSTCGMVVANDTGLMHVADALGVPPVLIFGPTSEELGCLPFHPQRRIIEHDLWCRPCSKNGQAPCIRGSRLCLEKTTGERVFQEVLSLSQVLWGKRA